MLRLNLGDLIGWEGSEYTVAAASGAATLLYRLADGQRVWVDLATLAAAGDLSLRPTVQQSAAVADQGQGEPLTGEEAERALWWEVHLNEVIHGVPDPNDPALTPRPGYDDPSKVKRRELKVEELAAAGVKVTARTLSRREALYVRRGLRGLLDQREANGRAPEADARVIEAVLAVLEDTKSNSTVSTATLINKVRAYVATRYRDDAVPLPSGRSIRRLIERYDFRGLARGKATTRRSAGNRPDRGPRPAAATYPGQIGEIDSTPVNVLCLMPDGTVSRPALTAVLDVATRSMLGFSMVPTGASGVEHADLLARILRPRRCRPDAPDWMRLDASTVLPHEQMVTADARQRDAVAVPYIVPEAITTDRGKDYLSPTFIAACRHFGISVVQAPPKSPTFKTHIERFLGAVETLWMQKQPGYIGTDPTRRGEVGPEDLLTLAELADSLEKWWIRVWQNRPHDGLRDRDMPSRRFTPNQMYAAMFDAAAGIAVPIDQATYIALMPTHRRVLQPGAGFQINNLTYWSERLQPLTKTRPVTRDGKWEVHLDPYDTDRAWVADPADGAWIECVSQSYRLAGYPFPSALRRLRSVPQAADPQDGWAEELLANQPARLSKKREVRKTAVLARRRRDGDPRPDPVADPEPPQPPQAAALTDEFRVVSPDEELWNAR